MVQKKSAGRGKPAGRWKRKRIDRSGTATACSRTASPASHKVVWLALIPQPTSGAEVVGAARKAPRGGSGPKGAFAVYLTSFDPG